MSLFTLLRPPQKWKWKKNKTEDNDFFEERKLEKKFVNIVPRLILFLEISLAQHY